MMIPRVIPCLLLKDICLYKTVKFRSPVYVGDAVNAVKIFNEKEVDELIFLDYRASIENRSPQLDQIRDIASECFMPLAYGGGISGLDQIEEILQAGAEKVILCSVLEERPDLITEAANKFGSQAIVVSIDYKKRRFGRSGVFARSGTRKIDDDPVKFAIRSQELGAGEVFLNAIDNDGKQNGYDLDTIRRVSESVEIPVTACGGAGELADFREAIDHGASAVAAGSIFVFHGKHNAVLITYPERPVLEELFGESG
jgi:cyclase